MTVERDEKGRLKKGVVLNPNGRPKGAKSLTTLLREKLQGGSIEIRTKDGKVITKDNLDTSIVETAIKKAISGDNTMIQFLFNRLDGMPDQKLLTNSIDEDKKEEIEKLIENSLK